MTRSLVWLLLIFTAFVRSAAAQTAWPGEEWETASPASQGMDAAVLESAKAWLESHNSKPDLIVIRQSDLAPAAGHQIAEYYQRVCKAIQN